MHERYQDPDLKKVWTDTRKFSEWLRVETTVLEAREKLGQIPAGTAARVRERTFVDEGVASLIKRRDKVTKHDLVAFKQVMDLQLILYQKGRDFRDTMKRWDLHSESGTSDSKEREKCFQEALTTALRTPCPEADLFHDGLTSYDVEEPAMALLLREACVVVLARLSRLDEVLTARAVQHRGLIMIGRTHGQYAQPITFGVKLLN
ncbi:MAG: lyase family protein, partial [Patescibacteria group bacterium]